jgi:surface polysaccharide O-acyltransferase-like enzyme
MVFSNRLKPAEHKAWADLCRVVAIFGVVLIHSLGAAFYQYGKTPLSDWLTVNFLDSLVRCAVPCFVMLSGALILRAGEIVTFPKLWRRIVKVLLPLLVEL